MSSNKTFEIELIKYLFFNTNYSPKKIDPRAPWDIKSSFKVKLKFGVLSVLDIVERFFDKFKILIFYKNGPLMKVLEDDTFGDFKYLYDKLEEKDRKKYIQCLAYRLFGRGMVTLPMSEEYYQKANFVQSKCVKRDDANNDFCKEMFDLSDLGYPQTRLWLSAFSVMITFMEQQYAYSDICRVLPGDYVIDAGGCYGDTALYFASLTGNEGKVYVFEFVPTNIKMMQKNLDLNHSIKDIINIIPYPLDEISNNKLFFIDSGPSSKVIGEYKKGYQEVRTKSIDDLVFGTSDHHIEKVDFIKMDIEGAELAALKGAIKSIKKFKPKLAICVYHKLEDFYEIPLFIGSLGVEYKFYFDYYTPVGFEMMLYCVPI